MDDEVSVVPANHARWEDLQQVFGTRGVGSRCQCQRYKLDPGETFAGVPAEVRADRLRRQTACDEPDAATTSGLVAFVADEPAGWCAVEPRASYEGLVRVYKVPWLGRAEDPADDTVWAVTCLFTRAGFRRRGISRVLAREAVAYARGRGARALEAYPMLTTAAITEELHVGTYDTYAAAGFLEVSRPTTRRAVMRVDFG